MKVLDKIQKHKFSDFDVKKGFRFHALDILFSTFGHTIGNCCFEVSKDNSLQTAN